MLATAVAIAMASLPGPTAPHPAAHATAAGRTSGPAGEHSEVMRWERVVTAAAAAPTRFSGPAANRP
jgi:hypothetical protein